MLDNLRQMENRLEELDQLLMDPELPADQLRYRKLAQEHAKLTPVIANFHLWQEKQEQLAQNEELAQETDDPDFLALVSQEQAGLHSQIVKLEEQLRLALIPTDPNDERNIIVEIRSGAGGDEAALFAADLFRMYSQYAERQGWQVEIIAANETEIGGIKEIIFGVNGSGAYSRLRYESGVHRVQRVPVTESGGRIHTSTVTVAVLPEAQEVDVEIRPEDLEIDTFRASGAGGQHVNRTDSAIRITHKPTGMVVTCQDQRSQHKNKERALAVLRSRLYEKQSSELSNNRAKDRRDQVGSGDRSERIRTYNFHQGRVTDHRIGLTLYQLDSILQGDLDELIEKLQIAAQSNSGWSLAGDEGDDN